jgi:hypothetical protein
MSTLRCESRRDSLWEDECEECDDLELEECLDDELEECLELDELDLDDRLEDFSTGTSRMFRTRPVVGSTVDETAGSCETWYPSMM